MSFLKEKKKKQLQTQIAKTEELMNYYQYQYFISFGTFKEDQALNRYEESIKAFNKAKDQYSLYTII